LKRAHTDLFGISPENYLIRQFYIFNINSIDLYGLQVRKEKNLTFGQGPVVYPDLIYSTLV